MIAQTTLLAPIVTFRECEIAEANALLVAWRHKMGPIERGDGNYGPCGQYVLLHHAEPVSVATHSTLIRETAGGGFNWVHRDEAIELSRLCAARPHLCRVMLRLWREFVFPSLGRPFAISYQDADLHNGNTYRFDGWHRSPEKSRSGTDDRSGKRGRTKWLWLWPPTEAPVAIPEPETADAAA